MPNRMMKDSLFTSEKISLLSDFEFRVWVSLILLVDDVGRGDARPAIIKGHAFPLRERVTNRDIDAALHGLADKGCVSLYTVDGKPYFYFPTWGNHQRIRDVKPKYPAPEDGEIVVRGNLPQPAANCGELLLEEETKKKKETETKKKSKRAPAQFTPPTFEEVRDYIAERGNKIDVKGFWDFYATPNERNETWLDSNGKPVQSWKQKVITWENNQSRNRKQAAPLTVNNMSDAEKAAKLAETQKLYARLAAKSEKSGGAE